jgi:hypothetical protein
MLLTEAALGLVALHLDVQQGEPVTGTSCNVMIVDGHLSLHVRQRLGECSVERDHDVANSLECTSAHVITGACCSGALFCGSGVS